MNDDPYKLREQAARLLALALLDQEQGRVGHSEQLTEMASEMLRHAEVMERRRAPPVHD